MSVLKLTSWQRRHLERQLEQTRDARLYRRTLALLALAQGQSAADIATLLCVTRQSIYNWVEPYTHSGQPAPLADGDRKGRPRRLGDDEEAFLRTLLAASPQELDYPNVSWTVPMLQEVLYLGTSRERTVRRALERLDYVWKRPRYVLAPDAEREKKTAYPAANPGLAAPQRGAGRRRNRPAALPVVASRMVPTRRGRQGLVERPQRPAGHLRSDELADGLAAVVATEERKK